jgi:putative MATE family efflux protein
LTVASVAAPPELIPPTPVFTTGSLMRHVVVMTATGSIGLIAIFAVDVLSLFWVSRLDVQALKAAIGYASQAFFLLMSVNIGLTIAISATVSRALGAGDRPRARRLAASGLAITFLFSAVISVVLFVYRDDVLVQWMHASGPAAEVASRFLAITVPANIPMGLGMALSGVFRAAGDAKRAMYVTLAGGIITAFADPLLIFGFGLGVYGAAWATVISRLTFLGVGAWGAIYVHNLVAVPKVRYLPHDFGPIMGIGLPAILANLAAPISAIYVTRVWSDFGTATVAGGAIVDRVIPLAFGVIFALTGSIVAVGYAICAWGVLALTANYIAAAFGATGQSADFAVLYMRYGALAWVFITCLFVANTVFNNLGFPVMAMVFNWGRATLGTIPFVTLGAAWGGFPGAVFGLVAGAAIFGLGGVAVAYALVTRLIRQATAS